jgi:hypothetical protein
MTEATEVQELLDRLGGKNFDKHTEDFSHSISQFTDAVVEEGTFTPEHHVYAELSLTARERLTGSRKQDVTAILITGMMLGAALERDIPQDSEAESDWRDGEFELPEHDE